MFILSSTKHGVHLFVIESFPSANYIGGFKECLKLHLILKLLRRHKQTVDVNHSVSFVLTSPEKYCLFPCDQDHDTGMQQQGLISHCL